MKTSSVGQDVSLELESRMWSNWDARQRYLLRCNVITGEEYIRRAGCMAAGIDRILGTYLTQLDVC